MKLLSDLFPVLLFFGAYSINHNIYMATTVAIIATVIQVAYVWYRYRKVDTMLWVSLGLIVVFGGATLFFHNKHFIMWKPTVLYWIMGGGLIIGEWMGKNGIQAMIGSQIRLPGAVWRKLCYSWAGFFLLMGGANLYVAYNYSENVWVNFKLFGILGLLLVFGVAQSLALAKYIEEE
jgi:intracellular septation protein